VTATFREVRAIERVDAADPARLRRERFDPGRPCVLARLYEPEPLDDWIEALAASDEPTECVVARSANISLISDAERPDVTRAAELPGTTEFFARLPLGEIWGRMRDPEAFAPLVQPGEFLYVFSAPLPSELDFPRRRPAGELGELLYADPRPRQLLINAPGVLNRCHAHVHTYLLHEIFGSKRVRLFSPADTPNLYPNARRRTDVPDFDEVDLGRFPKVAEATAYEGTLAPGDVLFLPSYWWHEIRVDELAVSIGFHAPAGRARDGALALHESLAGTLAAALARARGGGVDEREVAGVAAIVLTAAAADVVESGIEATIEGLRYEFD
jgi:hypothetical protein